MGKTIKLHRATEGDGVVPEARRWRDRAAHADSGPGERSMSWVENVHANRR